MNKHDLMKLLMVTAFAVSVAACGKKDGAATEGDEDKDTAEVPWSPPPNGDTTTTKGDTTQGDTTQH